MSGNFSLQLVGHVLLLHGLKQHGQAPSGFDIVVRGYFSTRSGRVPYKGSRCWGMASGSSTPRPAPWRCQRVATVVLA